MDKRDRIRRGWQDARGRSHVGARGRWACRLLGVIAAVALVAFSDLPVLSVLFLGLLVAAGALWVVDFWQQSASTNW